MAEEKRVSLEGRSVFIGIPTYDGKLSIKLAYTLAALMPVALKHGITIKLGHVSGCSIITMARNMLVDQFLKSDCTELLFIDADVIAQPEDILRLVAQSGDKDVTAGMYPRRAKDRKFFLDFYLNEENDLEFDGAMMRANRVGTGFMLIKREVFEALKPRVPTYTNDMILIVDKNPQKKIIHEFFATSINEEDNRLLSEDYHFCKIAREAGFKVWAAPWVELGHVGTYIFEGRLPQNS